MRGPIAFSYEMANETGEDVVAVDAVIPAKAPPAVSRRPWIERCERSNTGSREDNQLGREMSHTSALGGPSASAALVVGEQSVTLAQGEPWTTLGDSA
jgi:hypothetical protein